MMNFKQTTKAILYVILFVTFSISPATAQQNIVMKASNNDKLPTKFIGLAASNLSGMGVSYHFITGDGKSPVALKFTFGMTPDINSDYDIWNKIWIFAGAELQFNLFYEEHKRAYWFFGLGYLDLYVAAGTGFGLELYSGTNGIALNLDLGIGTMDDGVHYHRGPGNNWELMPVVGLGLSYTMK